MSRTALRHLLHRVDRAIASLDAGASAEELLEEAAACVAAAAVCVRRCRESLRIQLVKGNAS